MTPEARHLLKMRKGKARVLALSEIEMIRKRGPGPLMVQMEARKWMDDRCRTKMPAFVKPMTAEQVKKARGIYAEVARQQTRKPKNTHPEEVGEKR